MKNIIKSTLLLLCMVFSLAACNDDNSENPTLQTPGTFKLNTPAYAAQLVDLATSTGIGFNWSQPAYGYPVAAEYHMQFSLNNKWTVSADEAALDKTGKTKADYAIVEDIFSKCEALVAADKLAKGLQQLGQWPEGAVPASQKVYARCASTYAGRTIVSNVVEMLVSPYYVELKDAAPLQWYLVGSCIGDGKWGNSPDKIGTSLMPLFAIEGEEYDKTTGTGKMSYTDYFPADGQFKLVKTPGSWDVQIDYSKFTNIADNAAFGTNSDGNVVVKTAGYYTITVDTKAGTATIAKYDGTAKKFANIFLAGGHNNWNKDSDGLQPVSTYAAAENHNWTKTVTFTDGSDMGFKFTDASTWWGAAGFPYGTANTSMGNGAFKAGTYSVFFNDITGQFYFFVQE